MMRRSVTCCYSLVWCTMVATNTCLCRIHRCNTLSVCRSQASLCQSTRAAAVVRCDARFDPATGPLVRVFLIQTTLTLPAHRINQ